jgi:four helix bundle protein
MTYERHVAISAKTAVVRVADCEDLMAGEIRSYRDLDAWRVGIVLTERVYQSVARLPSTERFGLSAQMRRASVSVPSNIAEGQACGSDGRYVHHLRIACGSLGELNTHVEIARRLLMLPEEALTELEEHLARTGQVLHGLLRSRLRKRRIKLGSGVLSALGFWLMSLAVLG